MIKFFRKIRQRLLSENKFSKYLLYAIGEIVLVVIGILIALQINNWKEERKLKQQQKVVLKALYADFVANKELIQEGIEEHKYHKDLGLTWIKLMRKDTLNVQKTPFLDSLLFWGPEYKVIDFIDASLNNVINSEKLDLVENTSLKQGLIEYPLSINQYKDLEAVVRSIVIERIRPRNEQYVSLAEMLNDSDSFPSDYTSLLKDRKLSNDYVNRHWQLEELLKDLKNLEAKTDTLIKLIDKELENEF
ncbi:DUF6090 family protein [uncultured Croceitalea sp.]|uniref:DUF6090 family protein n=1 Tax=uncultured Croceitalea sp. TaxID=1798908 RepID=UPI003306612F